MAMKPINAHLRQVGYVLMGTDETGDTATAYRLGQQLWESDSAKFWDIVIGKRPNQNQPRKETPDD